MKRFLLLILSLMVGNICFGQSGQDNSTLSLNSSDRDSILSKIGSNTQRYTNDNNSSANANSYLFKDVEPSGYDLLSANASFSDKDQVQKIGFSPVRLAKDYIPVLSNLRLNITNSSGALTTGVSIGNDNSAYGTGRVNRIFKKSYDIPSNEQVEVRPRGANETMAEFTEYYRKSKAKSWQDSLMDSFDAKRLRHVFKWSVGYNAQFFSVLKSKSADGNYDSLNYHAFKGHNLIANVSYSFKNGSFNVNGSYNYFNKRKSADSTQQRRRYDGFSVGMSVRVKRLISEEALKEKDFYKGSLFIPSIYLGISYERQNYKGEESIYAEDKLKWTDVKSVFIDIAISPASQFRLAFPIKNSKEFSADGSSTALVAVLQYSFKLINLN